MTQLELIKKGLELAGYKEVATGSSKYIAYEHATFGHGDKVFVGKRGAVRVGHVSSDTISSEKLKRAMIRLAKEDARNGQ